ncbi:hypothetical protein OIV83_003643 [Microbotryomycetes sp. JL201]|nr:hypothetical protein OIV83_003643 [Microbotryomycetes sp. JL201]
MRMVAVLDLCVTVAYGLPLAWSGRSGLWFVMFVSLGRVSIVLGVVFSSFIESRFVWMVGQIMLVVLVALYRVNELVQQIPPRGSTIDPEKMQAGSFKQVATSVGQFLSQSKITAFYTLTVTFAATELILYIALVGNGPQVDQGSVRRRQSVSSRHHSLAQRRSSVWREHPIDQEHLSGANVPYASLSSRPEAQDGDADVSDSFSDDSDVEDDEDAIVDIPRPSLRSRRSAASFYYAEDGRVRSPVKARQGAQAPSRSGYGSFQ